MTSFRTIAATIALLMSVTACGGGGSDKPASQAPVTVTATPSSETPPVSEADRALIDSACRNYPAAIRQAAGENRRLEGGKTDPVVLMSIVWGASADKVVDLTPPRGSELDDAMVDVGDALGGLIAKADSYDDGVFDIAYELQAFHAADDAVVAICR